MPETSPILSIIVVSYNTRDMTLACLHALYEETTTPFELIVVDNNSSDGSADAIAAAFPDAVVMAERDNHGFAAANNLAAKKARGDYILLLNPDTVVLDGAVDALYRFACETPEAKIWGGRTLFGDKSLNPSSCWRRISLWNTFCRVSGLTGIFSKSDLFNSEAYGDWPRDTVRQVDIVSGCFFLMTRADWNAMGGFDLSYIMYGEEADLCLRAEAALAAKPMVTPQATIIHYGGASETVRADKMVRLMKAKTTLIKRHIPRGQNALTQNLFALWPWTRKWMTAILRRESAPMWADVWARRGEWRDGFPTKEAGALTQKEA